MNRLQIGISIATLFVAAHCWSEDWTYTIRPGDELWNLASKYCGSANYTSRLAAHNNLGDAKLIRPGSRIKIPVAWLVKQPTHAEVISVFGDVTLFAPEPQQVVAGAQINMGNSIETVDGSVVVEFADESTLVIAANSRVLFNVLTAYGDTGMVDTNLRFYRGRGTSKINRKEAGSKFRISTPSGTAAVRGTEFRVGVAPDVSVTETLSGDVDFATDVTTQVPGGFGIAASQQGVVKEPLLPAPRWNTPAGGVPSDGRVQWAQLPDAEKYRLLVFRATDLRTPIAQSVTQDQHFALAELSPGNYQLAVRGISSQRIEGYASELAVTVQSPPPTITKDAQSSVGTAQLAWQRSAIGPPYVVQVSPNAEFAAPTQINTSEHSLSLAELAPGHYLWRIKDSQSPYSSVGRLTIHPGAVTGLTVDQSDGQVSLAWSPAPGADGYRVEVSRAANPGEVIHDAIVAAPSTEISLEAYGAYRARVTAISNGLSGTAADQRFEVRGKPPWILSLLLLPLLAL